MGPSDDADGARRASSSAFPVSGGRSTALIHARRSFGGISNDERAVVISRARKAARIIVIATASIGENAEKSRRSKLA